MEAQVGDRLIVRGRRIGQPNAEGEVVEMLGSGPSRHLRVRWKDGHESIMFPGPDTVVEPAASDRQVRLTCRIDIRLEEDEHICTATATMMTERGVFRGQGDARRRPGDPAVPVIGEELAIARAVRELAGRLESAATDAMGTPQDDPAHLVT